MKKERNYNASTLNVPHIALYTELIGFFYATLGINFLISFIYTKFIDEVQFAVGFFILSVMFFVMVPIKMTSPYRGNRDLFATVGDGVVHSACTLAVIVFVPFKALTIAYVIELLIVAYKIYQYKSVGKKNKERNRRARMRAEKRAEDRARKRAEKTVRK